MRRLVYIVEDDSTGVRTAYPMMRGAKLAILKQPVVNGKIWRADVADMSGSTLYAALWNGGGLENWVLVNLIEDGRLKKMRQPDASSSG